MKIVGRYRLEGVIGKGAFGEVFKGCDKESGQQVAIKVISLRSLSPQLLKQLEVELSALKTLNSPYVIKLYDVIKTANNVYMAMEYCSGGDLERYLSLHHQVKEPLAKRWLWNLLEAFVSLRESGIVHRDIKLANILLSDADMEIAVVKLADFGFARFEQESSMLHSVLGTPMFMAPEVLAGKAYNYKVDVWSLGVLAYEMMVGKEAFQVTNIEELKRAQQREVRFPANCELSEDAKSLIRDLMRYDPQHRLEFENIKKHPFFTSHRPVFPVVNLGPRAATPIVKVVATALEKSEAALPEDYEYFPDDTEDQCAAQILEDYSFVEDVPLDLETIEDPDQEIRQPAFPEPSQRPGCEQAVLLIDYQCDLISAQIALAEKYDVLNRTLISFAVYLNCLNDLQKCATKTATLLESPITNSGTSLVLRLKEKIQMKENQVKSCLETLQEKLTSDDLSRSVLKFEDSGLRVEDRVLVQEASDLLKQGRREQDINVHTQRVKEALLLLTMACNISPGNGSNEKLLADAAREYRSLMGASFMV